jgi:class 3 adenylate cyclase
MSDLPAGGVGDGQSAPTPAPESPVSWQSEELGVAFFGLGRLREWHSSGEDRRVAEFLQSYYVLAGGTLALAGARLVKLNGGEGLCVIPADVMAPGIHALCELTDSVRRLARERGFDTHLNAQVHFGAVMSGEFGPPGLRRYDVIGKAVNVAARIGGRGVVLTAQAYRQLDHASRQRFDKHTPPISYHHRAQHTG